MRCDDTPYVYHTLLSASEAASRRQSKRRKARQASGNAPADTDSTAAQAAAAAESEAKADGTVAAGGSNASGTDFELIYAGTLSVPFDPLKLRMTDTGRLYYPAPKTDGGDLALVASHLALTLSRDMVFGDTTQFHWQNRTMELPALQIDEADVNKQKKQAGR